MKEFPGDRQFWNKMLKLLKGTQYLFIF